MLDMGWHKLTVAEFEVFLRQPENLERQFELIDGEIIQKATTEEHGVIAGFLITEIGLYLRRNPIGRVGPELSVCVPTDIYNFRQPDIAFTSGTDRPISVELALPYMPDLAVDIKAPPDTYKFMADRAAYYVSNGSKIVWLVYPEKKLVEVLTTKERKILSNTDILDGGAVLPGFQLPVSQIFAA